jgi:putative membrane protein
MFLDKLKLFLKGMAMGAADVVPGVSGGTIAFITGIYQTLIESLSNIDFKSFSLLLKGDFKNFWTRLNGNFLVILFAGIFTSIISLAKTLSWALEHHAVLVWSFFFGLVFASIFLVARQVSKWGIAQYIGFFVGSGFAYIITTLPAATGAEKPLYLILSGALAICAMILPGISGSFILLLLGAYSIVLGAIADFNLPIIAYVGIGAVAGLIGFTKVLKWVFKHYHDFTVALLSGFLLGSLNKLWPWKEVLSTFTKHAGTEREEIVPLLTKNILPDGPWLGAAILCIGGILIVVLLEKFSNQQVEPRD